MTPLERAKRRFDRADVTWKAVAKRLAKAEAAEAIARDNYYAAVEALNIAAEKAVAPSRPTKGGRTP